MSEWFEDWFESEDYLIVYNHRDNKEAELLVDLIQKVTKLKQSSSILDLACGAGRYSILFAKKGFNVTGVDLSSNLLKKAKQTSENELVKIEFIRSDLRNFKTGKRFDLVINLFTSFGYFNTDEENFKVFSIAFESLNKNGFFVFDFFNSEFIKKNIVSNSVFKYSEFEIHQERRIRNNRVEKKIKIRKENFVKEYNESVLLYDYTTLKKKLSDLGFKINFIFGDYSGNPFDLNNSERLIIFSTK